MWPIHSSAAGLLLPCAISRLNFIFTICFSRPVCPGRQDSVDTGGRRPGRMVGRNGWMIRRPSPNCSWGHNTLSIPTTGRLLSSAFILMCCCSAVQYAVKEKSSSDSHSGSGGGYNSKEIARPRHRQTGKSNWQGWVEEEEEENNKTAHSAVL